MRSKVFIGGLFVLVVIALAFQPTANAQSKLNLPPGRAAAEGGIYRAVGSDRLQISRTSDVAGRTVILDSLPQATAAELSQARGGFPRPLNGMTDAQYKLAKQRAAQFGGSALGVASSRPGLGAFVPSLTHNYNGLSQAFACPSCTPPDEAIAVAYNFGVQAVNVAINVFAKSDGLPRGGYPKLLTTFFGLPATAFLSDPKLVFDWNTNHFILMILQEDFTAGQSYILIGVSATSDPTGAWSTFKVPLFGPTAGDCADYPTLGQDHGVWVGEGIGGVYFGINWFTNAGGFCNGGYDNNSVYFVPKSALYAGVFTALQVTGFFEPDNGITLDTMQPANISDRGGHPRAVFLTATQNINFGGGHCIPAASCRGITTWAVSNPFGWRIAGPTPTFSAIFNGGGTFYNLPSSASEPGCSQCIETIDTRISGTTNYSAGSIFAAWETLSNVAPTPLVNTLNWVELHPTLDDNGGGCSGTFTNACPLITNLELRQSNFFDNGQWPNHGSAFFAYLQPDTENNVGMIFSYSDDVTNPLVVYTARRATQTLSTMQSLGNVAQAGVTQYFEFRWGDYAAGALDVASQGFPSFWLATQKVNPDQSWGTQILNFAFINANRP